MPTTSKLTKDDALALVQNDAYSFRTLADEFRSDKDVVLAAVIKDGYLLEYASNELKNDKDVVLSASAQEVLALQYASTELKSNKEVVLRAVTNNGYALKFADPKFKDDRDVVLAAILQDGSILWRASARLRNDPLLCFIESHKDFISEIDWPVVLKALLEKPDYFLNPEPYMQALIDGMENPYLMLAQYALNKDVVIEPELYPEIVL